MRAIGALESCRVLTHGCITHELTGKVRSADVQIAIELATQAIEHSAYVAVHQARVLWSGVSTKPSSEAFRL